MKDLISSCLAVTLLLAFLSLVNTAPVAKDLAIGRRHGHFKQIILIYFVIF